MMPPQEVFGDKMSPDATNLVLQHLSARKIQDAYRRRRNQHYFVTVHSTGSCLISCGGRKVWGSQTPTVPLAKALKIMMKLIYNEKEDRMQSRIRKSKRPYKFQVTLHRHFKRIDRSTAIVTVSEKTKM